MAARCRTLVASRSGVEGTLALALPSWPWRRSDRRSVFGATNKAEEDERGVQCRRSRPRTTVTHGAKARRAGLGLQPTLNPPGCYNKNKFVGLCIGVWCGRGAMCRTSMAEAPVSRHPSRPSSGSPPTRRRATACQQNQRVQDKQRAPTRYISPAQGVGLLELGGARRLRGRVGGQRHGGGALTVVGWTVLEKLECDSAWRRFFFMTRDDSPLLA